MKSFKKIPKQAIFSVAAVFMFAVLIGFTIYNLIFLVSNFNKTLNHQLEKKTILGFDIEGFEKLNLIKK